MQVSFITVCFSVPNFIILIKANLNLLSPGYSGAVIVRSFYRSALDPALQNKLLSRIKMFKTLNTELKSDDIHWNCKSDLNPLRHKSYSNRSRETAFQLSQSYCIETSIWVTAGYIFFCLFVAIVLIIARLVKLGNRHVLHFVSLSKSQVLWWN